MRMHCFAQASSQRSIFWRAALLLLSLLAVLPAAQPVAAAICAGSFGFAPKADYAIGNHPYFLALGDLNGDGRSDLAVANDSGNGISVLLASGSPGSFAAPVNYLTGNRAVSVAVSDLNADGRPDLAVTNVDSNTVSVLLASGSPGSFAAPINYPTGSQPYSVAAGDLNGDGLVDLAFANTGSQTISVLLANGSPGSFGAAVDYPAGGKPQPIVISDLNNDGRPDLVTILMSGFASVLLANGSPGSFAAPVTYLVGNFPTSIAVADLNQDGRLDLVAVNQDDDTLSVLLASGSPGTFAAKINYPTGEEPNSVTAGDLNGDGRLDLAVANHGSNTVSVLLASGSAGSFAPHVDFATGAGPAFAAIANLNDDGQPDLVVANHSSGTFSVFLNSSTPNPSGSFAPKTDYSTGAHPSSVALGDLNGDSRPDMAVGNRFSGTVSIFIASGSAGSFAPKVDYSVGGSPYFVATADLNNDGRLDLVATNGGGTNVSVLLASGAAGSFAAKVDYPVGNSPFGVQIGDLNRDGRLDLVVANQDSNTISVLLASGSPGTFAPKADYSVGMAPRSVAIGDLNGDGRPDLAVANTDSASVGVLLASGAPGSFAPMVSYSVGTGSWSVAISDLNSDGRLDLAVVNASNSTSTVSVLLASGAPGNFAPKVDYPIGNGPFMLTAGDLNGDGRVDLVFASTTSNSVSVLLASGSPGTFAPYVDFPVGTQPVSVAIGDLDGDGRADLAVANDASATVSVLLNQAAQTTLNLSTPAGVTTGNPFTVTATLRDACGNVATGWVGPVTLAIKPGTGVAGAALGGTTTVSALNGVANFSSLSLNKRGTDYVLIASAAGSLTSESAAFAVGNAPPVAFDDSFSTLEDTPAAASDSAVDNDTDADGDTLTGLLIGGPAHGVLGAVYTPATDYNGLDSITYRAYDGLAYSSNIATINLTILPVNDAPFFTKGANQLLNEGAGAQTVSGWATDMHPGPLTASDEVSQTLSFLVTNDNNALFAAQPSIMPDGTLSYTPAPNASGSATITVRLHDDGGTDNGGIDASAPQTFVITINAANQPPTLNPIGDVSLLENAGLQTLGLSDISVGPASESGQTLVITATSDNPTLIANPTVTYSSPNATGTLSFTPAAGAIGSASITVRATDSGSGVAPSANWFERSFVVFVGPVNHRPTIDQPAPLTMLEDSGAQQVALSGIGAGAANEGGQTLTVTATSDNPALIANPTATYSSSAAMGTLSFTPSANASGSAAITVRVRDDGGTANGGIDVLERTFVVQVTPVNDAPDFTAGPNQTIDAAAGPQTVASWASGFTPGPADEASQTLVSYTIVGNSDPSLFSAQPAVDRFGTLTYTPRPHAAGLAAIEVVAHDSGGTANGGVDTSGRRARTITITRVYQSRMSLVIR